ncbi:hypothetical protein A0O32_0581 [Anoxybacillus flavithermus]|uniref:Uncharacterized protein n=1 Tax=Anoxybacillus flavithermus TaxID=33934 RepID=A0A178TNA1_9BACL|nr:hypothetical protein TAF16_0865 [Anoxybacillus flavithermus]OAO82909.1 hypothetical protein A0O32_0581 [Anoxybacillus flavithermus]
MFMKKVHAITAFSHRFPSIKMSSRLFYHLFSIHCEFIRLILLVFVENVIGKEVKNR